MNDRMCTVCFETRQHRKCDTTKETNEPTKKVIYFKYIHTHTRTYTHKQNENETK